MLASTTYSESATTYFSFLQNLAALSRAGQIEHLSSTASPTMGLILSAASGNFISTAAYTDLVAALSEIDDRNPFSEDSTAARLWHDNEIKIVLGTVGDIWPAEIRSDLVIDALEHADKLRAKRARDKLAAALRADGELLFPDWEKQKRVPQFNYRVQRASAPMDSSV